MDSVAVTFWDTSLYKSADPDYYLPDVNFTLSGLIQPQKPDSCTSPLIIQAHIYSLNEDLGRNIRPIPGQHADSHHSECSARTGLGSIHEAPLVPFEHSTDPHSPAHAGFCIPYESEGVPGHHQIGLQSQYHPEGVGHQIHEHSDESGEQPRSSCWLRRGL